MANKLSPLSAVPAQLVAGDSLKLSLATLASEYPAADGYALSLAFVPVGGGVVTEVNAVDGAGSWSVNIAGAVTGTWPVGDLRWAAKVEKDGDLATVDSGIMLVLPEASSAADTRSHARKVLDSLNAAIEGRASATDLEHTLADGRQVKRLSHAELWSMRKHYAGLVAAEDRKAGRSGGPRRILMAL